MTWLKCYHNFLHTVNYYTWFQICFEFIKQVNKSCKAVMVMIIIIHNNNYNDNKKNNNNNV